MLGDLGNDPESLGIRDVNKYTSVHSSLLLKSAMTSIASLPNQSSQEDTINKPHQAVDEGIHVYRCPGTSDIRSVCPALNTLANHSYLCVYPFHLV